MPTLYPSPTCRLVSVVFQVYPRATSRLAEPSGPTSLPSPLVKTHQLCHKVIIHDTVESLRPCPTPSPFLRLVCFHLSAVVIFIVLLVNCSVLVIHLSFAASLHRLLQHLSHVTYMQSSLQNHVFLSWMFRLRSPVVWNDRLAAACTNFCINLSSRPCCSSVIKFASLLVITRSFFSISWLASVSCFSSSSSHFFCVPLVQPSLSAPCPCSRAFPCSPCFPWFPRSACFSKTKLTLLKRSFWEFCSFKQSSNRCPWSISSGIGAFGEPPGLDVELPKACPQPWPRTANVGPPRFR